MDANLGQESFLTALMARVFAFLRAGQVLQYRVRIPGSSTQPLPLGTDSTIYPALTVYAWNGGVFPGSGNTTSTSANGGNVFVGDLTGPLLPLVPGQAYTFRWKAPKFIGVAGDGTATDMYVVVTG